MATLKEYYEKDFSRLLSAHNDWPIGNSVVKNMFTVRAKVHLDFDSNTSFISYYVPSMQENPISVFRVLPSKNDEALKILTQVSVGMGFPFEAGFKSKDLQFSGRVFIYYEGVADKSEFEKLTEEVKDHGLFLHLRDDA